MDADPVDPQTPALGSSSFTFASPHGTVRVGQNRQPLQAESALAAVIEARQLLEEAPGSAVFGALPFDPHDPPALFVTRDLQRSPGTAAELRHDPEWTGSGVDPNWELLEASSVADFRRSVRTVLQLTDRGGVRLENQLDSQLEKVVLARRLTLRADRPVPPKRVFARLLTHHPQAYCYALDVQGSAFAARAKLGRTQPAQPSSHEQQTGWRDTPIALVGASPELVIRRFGEEVTSLPVAGSRPRHHDPAHDAAAARELLDSEKDRREHAYVVEHVRRRLATVCDEVTVPESPQLIATADLWHLATPITARGGAVNALELVQLIHPTPAVCGVPNAPAARLISTLEGHSRGLYSGAVGWCDADGDGEWALTLRCALLGQRHAELHAGVGVVAGSEPEAEVTETIAKFQTALTGLGVDLQTIDLRQPGSAPCPAVPSAPTGGEVR